MARQPMWQEGESLRGRPQHGPRHVAPPCMRRAAAHADFKHGEIGGAAAKTATAAGQSAREPCMATSGRKGFTRLAQS